MASYFGWEQCRVANVARDLRWMCGYWEASVFLICLVSLYLVFSIVNLGWGKRISCYSRPPIQLRWNISISLEVGLNTLHVSKINGS